MNAQEVTMVLCLHGGVGQREFFLESISGWHDFGT